MEKLMKPFIKIEQQEEQEAGGESCLICSNQCNPFQALWWNTTFKSLLGKESESEHECLSSHLLSIFILRKILNYPKAECEDLLKSMGVVHPGDWFRLCLDCFQGVEKILESLDKIQNLNLQIGDLKKSIRDKFQESLLWDSESMGETVTDMICARNSIRRHFKSGLSLENLGKSTRLSKKEEPGKTKRISSIPFDTDGQSVVDPVYIPEEGDDFSPAEYSDEDYKPCDEVIPLASRKSKRTFTKTSKPNKDDRDSSSRKRSRVCPKTPSKSTSPTTHRVCDVCKEWVKKSSYNWHMKWYHPLERQQRREEREKRLKSIRVRSTCDICGKSSASETGIRKHMRVFHKEIYNQRRYQEKISRQELQKMQVSEGPFECDKCNFTCYSKHAKTYHDTQHTLVDSVVTRNPENTYSCNLCNEIFPNLKLVYYHAKEKHRDELGLPSKTVTEDHRVGNVRVGDVVTRISEIEHKCNICSKIYSTIDKAANHARVMHRKELGMGENRIRVKSKIKRYKCPHCVKSFTHECFVQQHVKIVHDQVRDLFCDKCGLGFNFRSVLNHHYEVFHSEKKRELKVCDICGKQILTQKGLLAHKRRWHGTEAQAEKEKRKNGPQNCVHCGLMVPHSGAIKKHTREAHPELYIYMCSYCPQKFMRCSGLLYHQQLKHSANSSM